MNEMIDAICDEIRLQKEFVQSEISSIYFGGGTPSLLKDDHLSSILELIHNMFNVISNAEITLEANPEDITVAKVKSWVSAGINRVSLGVQSFQDNILKELNRAHSSTDAIQAVSLLKQNGINNLTLDLIYGIPGQSIDLWEDNLKQIVKLDVPHISCYALTIEPKTAFGQWQKRGKLTEVSEERYEEEYQLMCEYLALNNYQHYEVSNFAKSGFESKHNTSYWQQQPYLGIGPGAHSYNGRSRFYNISNNPSYIRSIRSGTVPNDSEALTRNNLYNEYLLTGFRTKAGLDLAKVEKEFGYSIMHNHSEFISKCVKDKLLILDGNRLIPTDKGLFLADSIIIEMMME